MAGLMLVPSWAGATPSTTYWAPSTASCQAFRFFFDRALQPGGRRMLWTLQLDVDVPLGRK
jgi:hypothetical protein